jgi:hypothetical protein
LNPTTHVYPVPSLRLIEAAFLFPGVDRDNFINDPLKSFTVIEVTMHSSVRKEMGD